MRLLNSGLRPIREIIGFHRAATVISHDAMQTLISHWRASGVPVTSITPDIREGKVFIRIGVVLVTAETLRRLPVEISGFSVKVEQESLRVVH
jgi:hypothetical protein